MEHDSENNPFQIIPVVLRQLLGYTLEDNQLGLVEYIYQSFFENKTNDTHVVNWTELQTNKTILTKDSYILSFVVLFSLTAIGKFKAPNEARVSLLGSWALAPVAVVRWRRRPLLLLLGKVSEVASTSMTRMPWSWWCHRCYTAHFARPSHFEVNSSTLFLGFHLIGIKFPELPKDNSCQVTSMVMLDEPQHKNTVPTKVTCFYL